MRQSPYSNSKPSSYAAFKPMLSMRCLHIDGCASWSLHQVPLLARISDDGRANPDGIIGSEADPSRQSAIGNSKSAIGKVRYFGDYELLEEIARENGIVFKAARSLNRLVSAQLISAGTLATEDLVKRFKRSRSRRQPRAPEQSFRSSKSASMKAQHYSAWADCRPHAGASALGS